MKLIINKKIEISADMEAVRMMLCCAGYEVSDNSSNDDLIKRALNILDDYGITWKELPLVEQDTVEMTFKIGDSNNNGFTLYRKEVE